MEEDINQPGPSNWRNKRYANAGRPWRPHNNQSNWKPSNPRVASNVNQRCNVSNRPIRAHTAPSSSHNVPMQGQRINRENQPRFIGFRTLEQLANENSNDILSKLNLMKDGFMNIINSPVDRLDVFVLVIRVLAKVSQSPFIDMKAKLILDVTNSNFVLSLRNYLMDLPYAERQSSNNLYWNNQTDFWKDLIVFCEQVYTVCPATATRKCRALIESVTKTCLDFLKQRHGFELPQEHDVRLTALREKLTTFEEVTKSAVKNVSVGNQDPQPPEDFRELSLLPTVEDLLVSKPFLRPNIVKGGYNDIQHYLDVQFRLLREDCFGPLRDGINQYLADTHKRKYDHVRIFQNVKFVCPYISNLKIGTLVQLDTKDKNYFKRVNWAHNKRFLFGSLVIFTKDQCNNFVLGTILDRDVNLLSAGKLPVSLFNTKFDPKLYNEDTYTMVESEVYFEPYYQVMNALQARTFPEHLPMQQYIVKVKPGYKHPGYLNNDTEFAIMENNQLLDDEVDENHLDVDADEYMAELDQNEIINQDGDARNKKFKVLQTNTWPNNDQLKMNDSQYEAFQLALTHEFAVIQGPPGTGKTYVGIKVAKMLLANVKFKGCTMLIVCYTNHALDQFLEAISKVTKSIVRIGGQSRNEAMENYNLTKLRKDRRLDKYFFEEKNILKHYVEQLKEVLMLIDILDNGVISCKEIEDDVADIKYLKLYFRDYDINPVIDPLYHWLFENLSAYRVNFDQCVQEIQSLNNNTENLNDRSRSEIILEEDNHKKDYLKSIADLSSFSMTYAKYQLTQLLATYNAAQDYSLKQSARDNILRICAEINLYNDMVQRRSVEVRLRIHPGTDFFKIPHKTRWCLYFMWINRKLQELNMKAVQLQTSVTPAVSTYEEARMMQDVQIIKERRVKVVGMTTSGAAKMRKLLQAIGPKIVIVEEAAEVLEQHIITSLTKDCQHLILIGDHQQLRPSASHMKLAKKYNIEVSLFERMITNGIHSRRLRVQHRMRPEIASLITPLIYPDLENHPSVEYFPNVKGIQCNLFFFTHNYLEEDTTANDSSSRTNHKEADLTLALANYIMQQGYDDEDVTILAAYSGQMFYMRKERHKYAALAKVKITVVDNYQGEESKIILLSLVRNNSESKIGFLGTENRICVALSRAKEGFYIFGNMDILKAKSELWVKIAATLESNGSLGDNLKLICQNHPDQITTISSINDFVKVPEGGCLQKCNFGYSCGHICLLFCHGYDREHVKTRCPEKCERIICELQHVCPLRCRVECQPCQVMVLKTLPCQHEVKVACHLEPDDPKVKCRTMVEATLPDCGHKTQKQCHIPTNEVKCTERCVYRVRDCGHACQLFCHVKRDPEHEKYVCRKPCARAKKGCTANLEGDRGEHQCPKICFEECNDCNVLVQKKRSNCKHIGKVTCSTKIDETPCKFKCAKTMECGHFCKKKCFEPCGGCIIMVEKEIPDCKHRIKIECMKIPSRELCKEKCSRVMSCGHECGGVCGSACDASQCRAPTGRLVPAPCGHHVPLLCCLAPTYDQGKMKPEDLLQYCKQPCGAVLACEHLCQGTCATCRQRRLHAPCTQTCNQIHICGHQCQEACNQICPPCNMMCEVECQHSRCNKRCGEPCIPCQERCSRSCPHSGACSRRCGEQCSVAACDAPCDHALPCGHACRGLCGEPCPPVCATCSPDTFPTGFLGEEFGPENKFVLLQDCGHVLEVEDMDNLMMGDQDSVQIRRCPYCRKPIINTNRYKDLINNMLKNEINPIKIKVFGTKAQIKERKEYLNKQMTEFVKKYVTVIKANPLLDQTLKNLFVFCKPQRRASLVEVEMLIVYLQYFDMITECCLKYAQIKTMHMKNEFQDHVKMLISGVLHIKNVRSKLAIKISQQQQKDVSEEIKRLNAIVQLSKILKWAEQVSTGGIMTDDLKLRIENVKKIVFAVSPFDENEAISTMKAIKLNEEVVQKYERAMIVKAIGLKAGHWFKCPNGHLYCIGECGGANQESKCVECGAIVGGVNHRLAAGNVHAAEMDGSKFPAYSDAANNLANFDLNNLF